MVQRKSFNLYLARTAGMLSGARRVAAVLLMMLLTMTAQTAWAQDPPQYPPLPDPDGDGNVTLEGGEYSVTSDVTISGNITANNPVNLTISNGATLTVGGHIEGGDITIDVQVGSFIGQTCPINVRNSQNATIEAGGINIFDYTTITSSRIVSNVICAYGGTFNGSDITVSSYLQLLGPVVFVASSPGVSIYVKEYDVSGGSLTISNGSLKDGDGNIYTGAIADPSALNGKTLTYYNPSSAITVSLNAQGGSGGTGSVTPTAGEAMPDITPPTRTGYTFGGYYTETNGGGTQYYNADGTSAHVCELTGTVTLYAKWTANTYTVTFDRQGGSGGPESVTATFGSAMPTLNPVPSRTDCEFVGYYTETNGGGTKYYNADGTSARTWGIDANTTLYAYWKKYLSNQDITVEIPAQTYNGSQLTPVVTVKDGNDVVSDAHYTIFLPEGRTNAGDYTINIVAKEGSTAYVMGTTATFTINRRTVTLTSATDSKTYDGNALTNDGVTVGGDGFADGEGVTYNVTGSQTDAGSSNNTFTYTLNDGTLAANYDITTVEGMLTITKAASSVTAAPTARSLVYDGFEQTLINAGTASGGTMYYSLDNSTWSTALPTATEAGEYTVYYKVEGDGNHDNTDAASIKAYIDYTITYDLAGGSVASANPTRYNVTTATFTLTNPTREGYDFAGWIGTGLIEPTMTVTIDNGSAGERSYTSTWETIHFEKDGITYEWTSASTVKVAECNSPATSLVIPASVDHKGVSYNVKEIGEGAFMNSNLTELYLTNCTITVIGARAFKGCTNLSKIYDLSASLTTIEDEAFSGCNLTEFTIPETVTSIGQRAFADCPSLTSVTIPETETIWGENPFEGCSENLIIYVPEHLVDTYRSLWPDANILAVGTIPYIAADGSTAYRKYGEYTELTGNETSLGTAGKETWYVVNSISDISDINYDHTITLNGKVNLILADGKTMNIGSSEAKISGYGLNGNDNATLTVYGQSEGTGNLNIYATYTPDGNLKHEGHGIYLNNTYTQYGGEVTIDGTSNDDNPGAIGIYASNVAISGGVLTINSSKQSDCIHAAGTFTISGGTVNTTKNNGISINIQVIGDMTVSGGTLYATSNGGTVICGNSNIYLNGGTVTANNSGAAGYGIRGNVTLGGGTLTTSSFDTWNNASSVTIASGFAYTNGEIVYNSATPSATLVALTDVTLTPKKDFTQCTATVPDQTLGRFNPATNSYYKTSKISYLFNDCRTLIGEEVKDGETILTLGTDYEFGSISYASPDTRDYWDVDKDKTGDVCQVEIIGKGDYAGTKTATFTIVDPSGTWGDANELTWSLTDGALSITGTGAMETADNYGKYPWAEYCSDVTSITIDEGVTSVAPYAFGRHYDNQTNSYSNVETVTLPSTLKSIGDQAFKGCSGDDFNSVVIPAGVTSIGADAFYGCTGVTDVYCYADPTKLTWDEYGCNDFITDSNNANYKTKCHVADATAWSGFSGVNVTFVDDLAAVSIPYIDANGNTQYCTDFTALTGSETSLAAGWYVVKSDVNFTNTVNLTGDVNLILADDKTMSVTVDAVNADAAITSNYYDYNLTIYGQSAGTGTLTATNQNSSGWSGISVNELFIYGGTVNATATDIEHGYGIDAGNVYIYGGTVSAKGSVYGINAGSNVYIYGGTVNAEATGDNNGGGIRAAYDCSILGGKVEAKGYASGSNSDGIYVSDNTGKITLGWSANTDRIYVSSYDIPNGTVSIADGKAFTDGTNTYLGTLTSTEIAAIAGQTLNPIAGVTLTKDGSGNLTATFDGSSLTTLSIPNIVTVNAVNFDRTFTSGTAVTLMLPFSLADGQTITGGTLYKFSGISKNSSGKWEATMTESATLHANTPYLLMPNSSLSGGNSGTLTIGLNNAPVTLNSTTAGESSVASGSSTDWEFLGSYEERHWYDGTDGVHAASNADEIGSVYGFAASSGKATDGVTDIEAGQFVRLASGAWLRPTRCYLKYKGSVDPLSGARRRGAAAEELPQSITVRLVGLNGITTAIGTLDAKTGELRFDSDAWYSLDGTRLDGKPSKKGVYINKGQKVVVK